MANGPGVAPFRESSGVDSVAFASILIRVACLTHRLCPFSALTLDGYFDFAGEYDFFEGDLDPDLVINETGSPPLGEGVGFDLDFGVEESSLAEVEGAWRFSRARL